MNERQLETAKRIMDLLLELPWDERADTIGYVQCNDVFCTYCGYGERDAPNRNCQCTNDE